MNNRCSEFAVTEGQTVGAWGACPECGSTSYYRHEIGCHSGGMPVCLINDMVGYSAFSIDAEGVVNRDPIPAGTEGQVIGVWCADYDSSCIVSFDGREVRCELSNVRRTYRTLAETRARSLARALRNMVTQGT
jgi:hypothetical protein